MSRVAVVGSINLDTIYAIDGDVTSHSKHRATHRVEAVGGSAANTARWLTHANQQVSLFSWVGDDRNGDYCMTVLGGCVGLDVQNVRRVEQPTPCAVCISSPTSKVIVTHSQIGEPVSVIPEGTLTDFKHIHVAARDSSDTAQRLLDERSPAATVSIELNGRRTSRFAPFADVIFSNADELGASSDIDVDTATDLLARIGAPSSALLVITVGSHGSVCRDRTGRLIRRPAQRAKIVDRTGGGDAFNAGFLSKFLIGQSVADCLDAGQQFAARCLAQYGGGL